MKCNNSDEEKNEDSKLPLQLAIVGKRNVRKSTLLNAILQENRVLVGPEAGLTRDSIRVQFEYEGRNIYLVDTAGWLERTKQDKGPVIPEHCAVKKKSYEGSHCRFGSGC